MSPDSRKVKHDISLDGSEQELRQKIKKEKQNEQKEKQTREKDLVFIGGVWGLLCCRVSAPRPLFS